MQADESETSSKGAVRGRDTELISIVNEDLFHILECLQKNWKNLVRFYKLLKEYLLSRICFWMSIQEAPEHGPHVFVNKPELGIASTLSEKADFLV